MTRRGYYSIVDEERDEIYYMKDGVEVDPSDLEPEPRRVRVILDLTVEWDGSLKDAEKHFEGEALDAFHDVKGVCVVEVVEAQELDL